MTQPIAAKQEGDCGMNHSQQIPSDTICVRCGAEAYWRLLDEAEQTVEIVCPDCGRFEISRGEFEQAEFDIAQAEDRRE
jgi:predicted RNA-binding Zn-ribbon protein involved in translation (DUF1610 family)